jgi:hypothetical protein
LGIPIFQLQLRILQPAVFQGALAPGVEYHLIDMVLFEDVPSMDLGLSEYFKQDAGITGIGNVFVDGVSQEIEKGLEQRVAEFFGGLPGSLTDTI